MVFSAALFVSIAVVSSELAIPANAANNANFDAGNIIADSEFYNGSSMSVSEIQNFLNSKLPTCEIGRSKTAGTYYWTHTITDTEGNPKLVEERIANKCLKDYKSNSYTVAANSYCQQYVGQTGESSALTIAKVSQACGINPKALLVTLQKEMSFITDTWPTDYMYDYAMGYGCNDSGPNFSARCQEIYKSFFVQLYNAAWQFKHYANANIGWKFKAGTSVSIQYNPKPSCGSSPVYIQGRATAALYNYTPYQPNAAALAGSNDGCGAYGNLNFWRLYNDWFGFTNSPIVKSVSGSDIYLITSGVKRHLDSWGIYESYSSLGPITTVSQTYLDALPTGKISRVVRGPSGSMFFIDSGKKYPITSCEIAIDFGGWCGEGGYIDMEEDQLNSFKSSEPLSNYVIGSNNLKFLIENGKRKEVLDDTSLVGYGHAISPPVLLSDHAINSYPLTTPITRPNVIVKNGNDGSFSILSSLGNFKVSKSNGISMGLPTLVTGSLTTASLDLLEWNPKNFTGFYAPLGNEDSIYLIVDAASFSISGNEGFINGEPLILPTEITNQFKIGGEIKPGSLIKPWDRPTIYLVSPSSLQPIESWDALMFISDDPKWKTISPDALNVFNVGAVALTGASLYRTPSNPRVYLINGISGKFPFDNFDFPFSAGFTNFRYTSQERLDAYPTGGLFTATFTCGATKYVAASGAAHELNLEYEHLYPFESVIFDDFMCKNIIIGKPAGDLIHTPDGKIYLLENGTKRHILSWETFTTLSKNKPELLYVSYSFGSSIPTGNPIP